MASKTPATCEQEAIAYLFWRDETEKTYDCLRERAVVNPETGEPFTLTEIDLAIQGAMENQRLVENWQAMPDITPLVWWSISDEVCDRLGIAYDEMCEVAL